MLAAKSRRLDASRSCMLADSSASRTLILIQVEHSLDCANATWDTRAHWARAARDPAYNSDASRAHHRWNNGPVPATAHPLTLSIACYVQRSYYTRDFHTAMVIEQCCDPPSGRPIPPSPRTSGDRRPRSSARELSRIVPHNSLRSRSICSCCGRGGFLASSKGMRRGFFSERLGLRMCLPAGARVPFVATPIESWTSRLQLLHTY